MAEKGNAFSRHPNMCAFCSSLLDGMPESNMTSFADLDDKRLVHVDLHQVMAEPVRAFAHS